jgi:DNA invertase Pin-like site-specific DNA recombinase
MKRNEDRDASKPVRALAYLRVSTDEQARSGLGLDAQRRAISEEVERRGWAVEFVVDDGYSARDLNRPGWRKVEAALKRREADVLVVAKLDRLSRSVQDFAGILTESRRQKWGLVVLDVGMDFTTPQGKAWAQMVAVFAELERELIGQRTRDAMAEAKSRGVTFGRKRSEVWQPDLVARVLGEREAGASYKAIAAGLDRDGIAPPGADSKRWYPSTVRRLVLVELPAEVA